MIVDYAELLIECQKKLQKIQHSAVERDYNTASQEALHLAGIATMLKDLLKAPQKF